MANLNQRTMYGANLGAQVSPPSGTDSGSSGSPTVEHIGATASPTVLDPTIDISLVDNDGGPANITLTLADGPSDGFTKTIRCGNDTEWTIVPAHMSDGATIVIDSTDEGGPGAVILVWNATLSEWDVVSLYNGVVP